MAIITRPQCKDYDEGFERIFGPPKKRPNECKVYNTTCPTPELCKLDDAKAPCLAGQVNDTETP